MDLSTSVKVAVRIRPLSEEEKSNENLGKVECINAIVNRSQIIAGISILIADYINLKLFIYGAGADNLFTFDHVFGSDSDQSSIYTCCVEDLVNAAFDGFNATILAYGQTGSGKTWTMGSSANFISNYDNISSEDKSSNPNQEFSIHESAGIIPRVIKNLFSIVQQREQQDPNSSYKIHVQFLEIYGEDIRDLLDQTKTSKVTIREMSTGEVFVAGAREELVTSYEQMIKALEDGTKHRVTAATKMNQTSSRSHAIFTVLLEHTIHVNTTSIDPNIYDTASENKQSSDVSDLILPTIDHNSSKKEVRKCKFHFVDLAGSERAKRTGAQGATLKEGIDINKGLLALGNVISALGDDQKKGKVFVPYRDSKLTRMLQDSLGGNSKTLMICCVSPASVNFNESLNALKYANRARNIKNKPVINRDPSLLIIDELKHLLSVVASELLDVRSGKIIDEIGNKVPMELLETWARVKVSSSHRPFSPTKLSSNISHDYSPPTVVTNSNAFKAFTKISESSSRTDCLKSNKLSSNSSVKTNVTSSQWNSVESKKVSNEICNLKAQVSDGDFEINRLNTQLKSTKLQASELANQLILVKSERDFYKFKWTEACPTEAQHLDNMIDIGEQSSEQRCDSAAWREKKEVMDIATEYLKEIETLNQKLAEEKSIRSHVNEMAHGNSLEGDEPISEVIIDDTSSIELLINQTKQQLETEYNRLRDAGININISSSSSSREDTTSEVSDMFMQASDVMEQSLQSIDIENDTKDYHRRQQMMSTQVVELGKSIQLKEQLVGQLTKSQRQYGVMKTFYEQKLKALSSEMKIKQDERDRLMKELQNISTVKDEAIAQKIEREKKLADQLKNKDEELKQLKKKQDELNHLSQVQSRYMQQLQQLESDIINMKKNRVELSKQLHNERKNHTLTLNNKAKEIERLKNELLKSISEMKKLGREKEVAEAKAKDAIKEGILLKKKVVDSVSSRTDQESNVYTKSIIRDMKKISKISNNSNSKRILSEEELKIKRWLDKKVLEMSNRDAFIEILKGCYESQLKIVTKKKSLEEELKSTTESVVNEDKVLLLEEQLSNINNQLDSKNSQIDHIKLELERSSSDFSVIDKVMETLKKATGGSVVAYNDLVRLLVDMLVTSGKVTKLKQSELTESKDREAHLKNELDTVVSKLSVERHSYDTNLTKLATDYEVKLRGIYNNISPDEYSPEKPRSSSDPVRLSVLIEESDLLRAQLARATVMNTDLSIKNLDMDAERISLVKEIENKNIQLRFLEEDRTLFKDMVDDLKSSLNSLGRQGKNIIDTIKDRAVQKGLQSSGNNNNNSLFVEYAVHNSDDDEDDTDSVVDKYEFITSEINRTNKISSVNNNETAIPVYDRLTNPSYYTGHMKNVFDKDLEIKRKKIQQIKNQEKRLYGTPHSNNNNTTNKTDVGGSCSKRVYESGSTGLRHNDNSNNSFVKEEKPIDSFDDSVIDTSTILMKRSSSDENIKKDDSNSVGHKRRSSVDGIDFGHSDLDQLMGRVSLSNNNNIDNKFSTTRYFPPNNNPLDEGDDHHNENITVQRQDMNEQRLDSINSPIPNVFSRLQTKFTGVHKHRHAIDEPVLRVTN